MKAWKTIDLDQQRSLHPTFKHLNEKKLSIDAKDFQHIISSRLNGIETKSVFIVKANNSNNNKKSGSNLSPTKEENLPMLTTISKELNKKKYTLHHEESLCLPLTKTFTRAIAMYRKKS